MIPIDTKELEGEWVHSHEEDGGQTQVFRPAGWKLPPSRGRRSLTFAPEGNLGGSSIGPDDRKLVRSGKWRLLADGIIEATAADGTVMRLKVLDIQSEKLVVEQLGVRSR